MNGFEKKKEKLHADNKNSIFMNHFENEMIKWLWLEKNMVSGGRMNYLL